MDFLIIQENGRHEGNRNFRECFSVQRALRTMDHSCTVWGKNHDNFSDISFDDYDVIIDLENYDTGWVPNLDNVRSYKILWVIDAHCRGMDCYRKHFTDGKYNLILQATPEFLDGDSIWFPNCFDDSLIRPIRVEKRAEVGFCGNKLNRQPYFDLLGKHFDFISDIFVIGEDMVRAINSYGIHFNINYNIDLNYRSFETIGCKIPLATNNNAHYGDLGFADGENCILYSNANDLIDKIRYALDNSDYLSKMAERGFVLSQRHTYLQRMKELEEVIKKRI